MEVGGASFKRIRWQALFTSFLFMLMIALKVGVCAKLLLKGVNTLLPKIKIANGSYLIIV